MTTNSETDSATSGKSTQQKNKYQRMVDKHPDVFMWGAILGACAIFILFVMLVTSGYTDASGSQENPEKMLASLYSKHPTWINSKMSQYMPAGWAGSSAPCSGSTCPTPSPTYPFPGSIQDGLGQIDQQRGSTAVPWYSGNPYMTKMSTDGSQIFQGMSHSTLPDPTTGAVQTDSSNTDAMKYSPQNFIQTQKSRLAGKTPVAQDDQLQSQLYGEMKTLYTANKQQTAAAPTTPATTTAGSTLASSSASSAN